MVLELHIWGPAFSLPSIDPQCLAAVAYCNQVVPGGEWVIVASSDPTMSPTRELPVLRDGATTVGGFQNIIGYLHTVSDGQWNLDAALDPQQKADCTAFTSFIQSQGQSLLDLSLCVSTENYVSTTRPAYSCFLHFPHPWILPPKRRAAAKNRTNHLGLSSLDIETANEEQKRRPDAIPGSEQIPQSLRRSKQTVTSIVKQPQHAAKFRLDTLMDGFFEPLQDLLGKKRFFFSEESMSSLDCLALGYLALAVVPELPQSWLADSMKGKYGGLCTYVKRGINEYFGWPVKVEDAIPDQQSSLGKLDNPPTDNDSRGALPWKDPAQKGFISSGGAILEGALESIPLAGAFMQNTILIRDKSKATQSTDPPKSASTTSPQSTTLLPTVLAIGSALAAIGSYVLYSGLITLSPNQDHHIYPSRKQNLSDMGEAGAMLAMANFRVDEAEHARLRESESEREGEWERDRKRSEGTGVVPVVEVDVEVEDGAIRGT